MSISFDNEMAVASILLADWPKPLVGYLGRYFQVREGMIRLDYSHLSADGGMAFWLGGAQIDRKGCVLELKVAALQGPIALTLTILGHGLTGLKDSSSILDQDAYRFAVEDFVGELLDGDSRALRETILAEISPREKWVSWLLKPSSYNRERLLGDEEVMAALLDRTTGSDCIDCLNLVVPNHSENNWAFEQLVVQHWRYVRDYLDANIGTSPEHSVRKVPALVFSLFANSPTVQASRWACEQILDRADPAILHQLIQYCRAIEADDVRSLFQRLHIHAIKERKEVFKDVLANACLALATVMPGTMPSDLVLAAAWHELGDPARSDQNSVAISLKELPSDARGREAVWNQLGPAAREAWRQELLDHVSGEPELAQGLLDFSCRWLEQKAFAEVEPVLLRLMDHEEHLAFASRLASSGSRQVQLRIKGLIRSCQGALGFEEMISQGEDPTTLPNVGAQTWLGDPSVERVIHGALREIEAKFCHEYSTTWREDEEAHTARLLALTQEAVGHASRQLRQLSATTQARYPSLSVKVRQPSKREEGTVTPAGAPLGADILFMTHIVDEGKTVIQRATLVQVKKRSGIAKGKGFSSTIRIDLQQCEDMLKQSEHAYYLFATPVSPRPALWVAPARLVRNLTQLYTSKTSVLAIQVRDASCSYADFFLYDLVGLWAGDEDKDLVTMANGDPQLGLGPRHIVDIEVRRQAESVYDA